ncbi:MAG: type III pantothenate kinase [Gammaproteobacteria bacterium]|jgi:type III pantothenate kinase|nr:type III pantothenate kinase [Gammaproteobacteria bacterium]
MRLLIDAGNSRLKWALSSGSQLQQGGSIDIAEIAQGGLESLFNGLGVLPGGVWVANVAGQEMRRSLLAAAPGLPASAWHFQTSQARCMGLINGYRQPELLGVDRWLAMLAAFTRVAGAVCVMDAGTACTLDAVGSDGCHLGGVIVPGAGMMQASLRSDTRDIDLHARLSRGDDTGLFARSTAGAIASGSIHALAALAERGVNELARICGDAPTLVLSGGDGDLLARHCQVDCIVVPELVLEGLNLIAENQL